MRKTVWLLLALAAAAAGCARDEPGASLLRIRPSIRTRVTGLHFDAGDRIGVSVTRASGEYVRNRPMTYDGEAFAGDVVWYPDRNESSTLTAYYPYSDQGMPATFDISLDQTGGCASSDLLGAVKTDVTPASAPVGMLFCHLMSELRIVVNNTSGATVTGVVVGGFAPTAEVDFTNLTARVLSGVAPAEVEACPLIAGTSYLAVLVPQTAELSVTVRTSDGKSYGRTIPTTFESGYSYDMTVDVKDESISVQLSGQIGEWKPGGSLDGGTGGDPDPGTVVIGSETYRTRTVGGRVWMAENMRNMPAGAVLGAGVWHPAGGADAVAAQGMLYNHSTATGGVRSAAGAVRGICPEGWHVPTDEELALLVGADCGDDFFCCAGWWMITAGTGRYGTLTKGYLMSSTLDDEGRCRCLGFSSQGLPPSMSALSTEFGLSLRCIRDAN